MVRYKLVFELRNGRLLPFNRKKIISEWLERSLQIYSKNLGDKGLPKYHICFSDLYVPRPWRFDANSGIIALSRRSILKISLMSMSSSGKELIVDVAELQSALNAGELKFGHTLCYLTNLIPIDDLKLDKSRERFEAISPVVVSEDRQGKVWYLEPSHPKFYERLKQDLIEKYQLFYQTTEIPEISVIADFERTRTRKIAHAIRIGPKELVRGYKINFSIVGKQELIKLAYEWGIGEKNDLGFGMLELSK